MASQFQNRLVGALVLVAAGVILLPTLFDGDKKFNNEDKFAAIPLVPKPGEEKEIDAIAPITQTIPSAVSTGAAESMISEAISTQRKDAEKQVVSVGDDRALTPIVTKNQSETTPQSVIKETPVALSPMISQSNAMKEVTKPQPEPKIIQKQRIEQKTPVVEQKQPIVEDKSKKNDPKAPQAQAYIIQLGALKNAAKVEEIVAKLRLSGHQAYTMPSTPVNGQLTRIFVGPNTSKQKLMEDLPELNSLSGLHGQLRPYK